MWGRRKKCDLQYAKERFKMCQTYDHKEGNCAVVWAQKGIELKA
jgi:hypothetical protein